jgi:hypothetical protein
MRIAWIASIAAMSSGCLEVDQGTLVRSAADFEEVPNVKDVNVPPASEVTAKWQLSGASPWAPYAKYTLFSAIGQQSMVLELPDVHALEVVHRAEIAAGALASVGLPRDTLWIIDLRGAASVAFGATLSRASGVPVAPVVTFNNWPEDNELVPAEETLGALIEYRPRMPEPLEVKPIPVFLLDNWRLAYREEPPEETVFDNRYMLNPSDLPSATALRDNGITRVVYVTQDLTTESHEEDDLHEAALAWQQAGISMHMVGLNWFSDLMPGLSWDYELQERLLVVQPRVTVVDSVRFYAGARGGFGGVHGRPAPMHAGGISHGAWGGGGG